jgi:hypothetical protein
MCYIFNPLATPTNSNNGFDISRVLREATSKTSLKPDPLNQIKDNIKKTRFKNSEIVVYQDGELKKLTRSVKKNRVEYITHPFAKSNDLYFWGVEFSDGTVEKSNSQFKVTDIFKDAIEKWLNKLNKGSYRVIETSDNRYQILCKRLPALISYFVFTDGVEKIKTKVYQYREFVGYEEVPVLANDLIRFLNKLDDINK